jgi:hypothetical protein
LISTSRFPKKLRVCKALVAILGHPIVVNDLAATIPSSTNMVYPFQIRGPAEVETVEMMEVEVEMEVGMVIRGRSLLGVCTPPTPNGPLRTSCAQCPRSLGKVSEMLLKNEILPLRKSLGPEFGTPTPSMGKIPISSAPFSSRASSISRIAPQHLSGITRRSII